MKLLSTLTVAMLFAVALVTADETVVKINNGTMQGFLDMDDFGQTARAFFGVPYAKPPVDELRWAAPVPTASWSGTYNATYSRAGCPQQCQEPHGGCPELVDEDCLYLTVFTPRLSFVEETKTYTGGKGVPVMVFLHGGNFRDGAGSALLYRGTHLVNATGVVLVNVNYRLGATGFLATSNGEVTGNYGILDQQAALRWVRDNIAAFGGDPERVTLFGQSAGAVSAAIHLYSPNSAGLFQNALLESEPYGIPLRTKSDMYVLAKEYFKLSNCSFNDVQCLRSKTWQELVEAEMAIFTDFAADPKILQLFMPWVPMTGTDVVPKGPYEALSSGMARRDIVVVAGNTRQEGVLFVYSAFTNATNWLMYDAMVGMVFGLNRTLPVLGEYPVKLKDKDTREEMSTLTTDSIFLCVNRNITRYLSHWQPSYYYVFDHPMSFASKIMPKEPFCWDVSCHADELVFVFHPDPTLVGLKINFTSAEIELSKSVQRYWSNLAYTRDPSKPPNGPAGQLPIHSTPLLEWPQYETETSMSMHFHTPSNYVDKFFLKEKCDFFDQMTGYVWP